MKHNTRLERAVEIIINSPTEEKTLFYHSEVLHMIKEGIEINNTDILKYDVMDRKNYTDRQWSNLVKLATILDFTIEYQEGNEEWFRSPNLKMEKPWFAHNSGESRTILVLFSPQIFVKHQCFYFPHDLKVV